MLSKKLSENDSVEGSGVSSTGEPAGFAAVVGVAISIHDKEG